MDLNHEIRDPVHGLIGLTGLEVKVINSRPFQRLRNIKQLALANLVFPGAIQTRFEHSLGTMHVAYRIAEHLRTRDFVDINDEDLQNLRLAGLLHDIGHGPFSHVSEELLKKHYVGEGSDEEIHEKITYNILQKNEELVKIIGSSQIEAICNILTTERSTDDYRHDIVSGSIDADKMDYLLRDSYYSGVKYGVFDLDRLVNVMAVHETGTDTKLIINAEGIETVEQYVFAKYFLSRQVYQHRIRMITDHMIVRGISSQIVEGNEELRRLYTYSDTEEYCNNYLDFDDQKVTYSACSGETSDDGFFYRLGERRLLKELYNGKWDDLKKGNYLKTTRIALIKGGKTDEIEKEIAEAFGLSATITHLKLFSLKNPSPFSTDKILDEEAVYIRSSNNSITSLNDESDIFRRLVKDAGRYRVAVYGDPSESMNKLTSSEITSKVEEIIKNYIGGN